MLLESLREFTFSLHLSKREIFVLLFIYILHATIEVVKWSREREREKYYSDDD